MTIPKREIRAFFGPDTIRVYQAYSNAIADSALEAQTFVSPPFSMTRMTWIKPSFLWMMYRSGWGLKDAGQSHILGIDILRGGFEWALKNACPTHRPRQLSDADWEEQKAQAPVRIQWDPERDLQLTALPYRTIQIGLGRDAVERYVSEWIVKISDLTSVAHEIHALTLDGREEEAHALLPREREYPAVSISTK